MPTSINKLVGTFYEAANGKPDLLDAVITDDWDDIPLGHGQEPGRDCNLNGVTPEMEETSVTDVTTGQNQEQPELSAADEQLLRELTERARTGGLKLTGEGGLLGKLTKMVVEGALEGELDDHLGYAKHDPAGRNGGNSRNGYRDKTVLTEAGPVELSVPRDRDASFEPRIVAKKQRRLTGIDDLVISLSAKGLTHGEITAHLAEIYGAEVSKQTITAITDRVMEGLADWQSRPLDAGRFLGVVANLGYRQAPSSHELGWGAVGGA